MNEKLKAALKAHQKPLEFTGKDVERARRIEDNAEAYTAAWDEMAAAGTWWDSKVQREGLTGRGMALRTQRKRQKRKGHRRNDEESKIINRIK